MASSLVFRLHDRSPELLREVLLERGWEEYDERKQEEDDWNLYWRSSAFHSSEYHNLLPWQRLNHHPKTFGITRKDCLARNLRRMRTTFGSSLYDFSPTAFNLPNDYTRFLAEYDKLRLYRGHPVYWICKPVDLSRGRGIFIFEGIKDLVYDCPMIVQRYISNPLLISGYKFDLRIYVCVKSFHPLTVYIHQEGLVRFATEKYNLSSLQNLYSHLTNTSINRFGPFYKTQKGRVGQGCKWTMSKFRHFLHSLDINELLLWQRINNIITLTLLTIASSVPSCPNCLELFGFDILVDIKFKPWLLEVNYSPALTLDCQADNLVKKGLISDLIDLMNYTSIDRLRDRAYQKHKHLCFSNEITEGEKEGFRGSAFCLLLVNQHLAELVSAFLLGPVLHGLGMLWLGPSSAIFWVDAWSSLCGSQKPERIQVGGSTAQTGKDIPPVRVGNFIRTFPFNAATLKASQHKLDVKKITQELQQLTGLLASGQSHDRLCKGDKDTDDDDCFDSLLWGPKDPPLLSQFLMNLE
ncbi:probable tubulin polyglutamylase TTLL2 [Melanotaenia boesemani]|uniref:probable tubulin polyglutamylase TTLL2 n=1 Tax=Melanotaenia boesemani TaxID=1250792 RepID=UPI001C05AE2E|nr:probable tubulin polyglutamylase TTLL2 [Melanotaenia boesemani]